MKYKAVTVERKKKKYRQWKHKWRRSGKCRSIHKLYLSKDLHLKVYNLDQMVSTAADRVDSELAPE